MPQFTLEPNPKQNPTRAAAQRGSWVIELPAAARTNEGRLRAAAARLLELAPVRSVIVDRDRTQAKVRLKSSQSQCALDGEILIHWPAGNVAAAAHLPIIFWTDPCDESLCFIKLPVRAQGWRRALLLMAAVMALLLGLIGIILPGLPTTPFVLVASYCLLRSSPALHERLIHSRLFGGVLRDWHLHRGIRPHVRYKALVVVLLVLTASLALTNLPLATRLAIVAVAACGIAYIWRLPDVVEPTIEPPMLMIYDAMRKYVAGP